MRLHDYLRYNTGQQAEPDYNACVSSVNDSDLESADGRKKAIGNAGRCAADAYCATYGIPPGVCSSVAGPIVDVVTNFFSDLFGGETIDCTKASTFDPCHPCNWVNENNGSIFGPTGSIMGGYDLWRKTNPACVAWINAAPERLKASVESRAYDALVDKYEQSWKWMLSAEAKLPYAELQQDIVKFEAARQSLIKKGAIQLTNEELSSGNPTVVANAIESVNDTEKSNKWKWIALAGALGGIVWYVSKD